MFGDLTFINKKNDVARLSVPVTEGTRSLEAFFNGFPRLTMVLNMGWDKDENRLFTE
jgi:hypothetical protein